MKKACILLVCLMLCGIVYAEPPQIILQSLARVHYFSGEKTISGGSGVVLKQEYVLSCYHIIRGKPVGELRILITNGKESRNLGATIVKTDPERDLLLLKLDEPVPWETAKLAKKIEWGEKMYFGGYSALPLPLIRIGNVTTNSKGIYVHPIYYGDSGGGVFNETEQLIGIMYLLYEVYSVPTLAGYAIPLNKIKEFLPHALQK